MTSAQLIYDFRVQLDKVDTKAYAEVTLDEVLVWLNIGQNEVVNVLYKAGRYQDLLSLVNDITLNAVANTRNQATFTLPANYMYPYIGSFAEAVRSKDPYVGIDMDVLVVLHEQREQIPVPTDGFSAPIVRVAHGYMVDSTVLLYKDYNTTINKLHLSYLKKIDPITATVSSILSEWLHPKIVLAAVNAAIEGLEGIRVQTNEKELAKRI
jgi:hypothetical protein